MGSVEIPDQGHESNDDEEDAEQGDEEMEDLEEYRANIVEKKARRRNRLVREQELLVIVAERFWGANWEYNANAKDAPNNGKGKDDIHGQNE